MTHRVAVLDQDLCQPQKCGLECIKYCPVNKSGAECVTINEESKKAQIDEDICNGCGICVKVCPFDAITIVNLASELATDKIHQYGDKFISTLQITYSKERRSCRAIRKKRNGEKYCSKYSIRKSKTKFRKI